MESLEEENVAQPCQDNLKNGLDSSGIAKRTGGSKQERDVIYTIQDT